MATKEVEARTTTSPGKDLGQGIGQSEMNPSNVNERQKRLIKVPPKLSNFVGNNKLSGHCPGCRIFVEDGEKGVVCEQCKAYWHYQCANVTQYQIDTEWSNEFLCEAHREGSNQVSIPTTMNININGGCSSEEPFYAVTVKINPYFLDKLSKVKFKLDDLESEMAISPKACRRQHSVKVNSVTYQIIMANLEKFGYLLGGMEIKRADTDSVGENVQVQYYTSINDQVPISVTCYHTTNNILIQLRSAKTKGKKKNTETEVGNRDSLRNFVNNNFSDMIQKIETRKDYQKLKLDLHSSLNRIRETLEHDKFCTPQKMNSVGNGELKCQGELSHKDNLTTPVSSPKRRGRRCNDDCENTRSRLKLQISSLEKAKQMIQQKLETSETHQESLRKTITSKDGLLTTQAQVMEDQTKTINSQKKLIAEQELRSKTHSEFASSFLDIMMSEGNEEEDAESCTDNSKVLKQLHEKIRKLEEEEKTYQSIIDEGKKTADSLQENVEETCRKLTIKCKEFEALKTQLSSMEVNAVAREQEIKAAHKDQSDMRCRNESLIIENDKLRKALFAADEKNNDLVESNEKLKHVPAEGVMEQIVQKSKEKDELISQLKENIDFTEKSLEEKVVDKTREKDQQIDLLKETITNQEKLLSEAKTELKKETTRTKKAYELVESEKEKRVFYQDQTGSLSLQIRDLETQLKRSRKLQSMCTNNDSVVDPSNSTTVQTIENHSREVREEPCPDSGRFPCIFEVKKKGLCLRKEKCKFDHGFVAEVQSNSEKVLAETSQRIGKCAFEMTEHGSCPGEEICKTVHQKQVDPSAFQRNETRVCFRELVMEGSCPWGSEKCRFSHKITKDQREDQDYIQAQRKEKDSKASKCIHEFRVKDGCRNKDRCSFSHNISESDRNDEAMKENIKEKLTILKKKQVNKIDQKANVVQSSHIVSKEVEALRKELLQMKEMMMSFRRP